MSNFVKENKKELEDATQEYFKQGCPKLKSVVRYATALSKRFQAPDVLQMYLLARTCNAHMHVFFKDFIWSTVWNNLSFYVAVNIAVVGSQFILLRSHEEEMVETMIGEVRMFMDCEVASMGSDLDVGNSDFDSEVGEDGALLYSDADRETDSICEKLVTGYSVVLKHLMLYEAFPTLCLRTSVPVERLS